MQQQNSGVRKQARAAWLALYDTLSPDQKLVVRDAVNARIAQAEAFRAQMRAPRTDSNNAVFRRERRYAASCGDGRPCLTSSDGR